MTSSATVPPNCGVLDVLRNPHFAQGYRAIARRRPSVSAYAGVRQGWFFELGRLIASEALEKLGQAPKLYLVRHADNREDGFVINPIIVDLAWPMLAELPNPYVRELREPRIFDSPGEGLRA